MFVTVFLLPFLFLILLIYPFLYLLLVLFFLSYSLSLFPLLLRSVTWRGASIRKWLREVMAQKTLRRRISIPQIPVMYRPQAACTRLYSQFLPSQPHSCRPRAVSDQEPKTFQKSLRPACDHTQPETTGPRVNIHKGDQSPQSFHGTREKRWNKNIIMWERWLKILCSVLGMLHFMCFPPLMFLCQSLYILFYIYVFVL